MFKQLGRSSQGMYIGTKKTRLTIKDKTYMDFNSLYFFFYFCICLKFYK